METCLAETGVSIYYWVFAAFLLIGISGIVLRKSTKRGLFITFIAGALVFQSGASPVTYAAVACPASAQPDVSTGLQGQVQSYSILRNDTPSPGSTFVLGSLRLGIVTGQVLGTSISDDKKTVSSPNEGVYLAQSDGIIRFTPDPNFLGQAKGVNYFIDDTAGVTSSSIYRPTVTSSLNACTNPDSQGITLVNKQRIISSSFIANGLTIESKIDDFIPRSWDDVKVSSNGENLTLLGDRKPYTSNDGGATVQKPHVRESLYWDGLASSSDVQKALANIYDEVTGKHYLYTTNDGGITWLQRLEALSGSLTAPTSSANGTVLGAVNETLTGFRLQISTDGGITWSERDPGISIGSYAISDDGSDVFVVDPVSNTLRVSHDGGVTWTSRSITMVTNYLSKLEVSADGNSLVLFAKISSPVGKSQIFVTNNDGATWVERTGPWGDSFVDTYDISNDIQTITLAAVNSSTFSGHIYRTINGGITWTQQVPFNDFTEWTAIAMTDDGSKLKALIYDDSIGKTQLHSSNNAGATWTVENTKADQAFTPQQVDIDTTTPGQQLTFDRTETEGWRGVYNPATDIFTLTVTNSVLFLNLQTHQVSYTFIPVAGCSGPVGPGNIVIRTLENQT